MSVYAGGQRFVGAEVTTCYHDGCLALGGLKHEIDCVNDTPAEAVMVLMHPNEWMRMGSSNVCIRVQPHHISWSSPSVHDSTVA
jgi:hypothetical protein